MSLAGITSNNAALQYLNLRGNQISEMDEIKKPDTMTTQKEKSFEFGPTADKGEAMQPADIRTDSEHETEQDFSVKST